MTSANVSWNTQAFSQAYCFLSEFHLHWPRSHSQTSKTSIYETKSLITLTYKSRKGKWQIHQLRYHDVEFIEMSNKREFSLRLYCLGHQEDFRLTVVFTISEKIHMFQNIQTSGPSHGCANSGNYTGEHFVIDWSFRKTKKNSLYS